MDIGGMDPDNWVFADPTISVSAVAFPSPGGRLPFSSNSKLVSPGSDRDIEYTMQQLEPANGGTFNPALTLPELLLRVFSFLPAGDLFNDALVCKTWLPAALETLWTKRDVPLHAVLGILPFLRRTSDGYMIAWDLVPGTTNEVVDKAIWTMFFEQYSAKITRICLDGRLTPEALTLMQELPMPQGGVLCPRLRHVHMHIEKLGLSDLTTLSWMLTDLNPNIHSLSIEGHSPLRHPLTDRLNELVAAVATVYLNLREFKLGSSNSSSTLQYALDCRPLQNLRVIALEDANFATWCHLADLPLLEEAYVTESRRSSMSEVANQSATRTFPALRILELRRRGMTTAVLHRSSMPELRKLRAAGLLSGENGLKLLSEQSPDLEELEAQFNTRDLKPTVAEHLSTFHQLRILRLSGYAELMRLTDEEILGIARSCPDLEHFSLAIAQKSEEAKDTITVTSFLALIQTCQLLETLEMPLNLKSFDQVDESSLQAVSRSPSLTSLTICRLVLPSRIHDAAIFLASFCPSVRQLKLRDIGQATPATGPWDVMLRNTLVNDFNEHQEAQWAIWNESDWCVRDFRLIMPPMLMLSS